LGITLHSVTGVPGNGGLSKFSLDLPHESIGIVIGCLLVGRLIILGIVGSGNSTSSIPASALDKVCQGALDDHTVGISSLLLNQSLEGSQSASIVNLALIAGEISFHLSQNRGLIGLINVQGVHISNTNDEVHAGFGGPIEQRL